MLSLTGVMYIGTRILYLNGKPISGRPAVKAAVNYVITRPNLNPHSTLSKEQHGQLDDHGMGNSYGAVVTQLMALKTPGKLCQMVLLSPDPALMAFIPEPDRLPALRLYTTLAIEGYTDALGLPPVLYSFGCHDKLDILGRQQLHSHGVLPALTHDFKRGRDVRVQLWDTADTLHRVADEQFRTILDTFVERRRQPELQSLLIERASVWSTPPRQAPALAVQGPTASAENAFQIITPAWRKKKRKLDPELGPSVPQESLPEGLAEPSDDNTMAIGWDL